MTVIGCYRKVKIYDRGGSSYRYGYKNFAQIWESWEDSLQALYREIDQKYAEGWEACQCNCERCSQTVQVTDDNGVPISGITVTAIPNFTNIWLEPSRSCTTGSDGTCTISDLVSGKFYTISVSPPDDYTCVSCTKTVQACDSETISFSLKFHGVLPLTLVLAPPPALLCSLQSFFHSLSPLTLKPLPSLSLSELKNILFTLSRTLPSLPSLSVTLELISQFPPKFTLEDLPSLLTSLELLPFPHDVLTDTIIAENARAVAEAAFEHARRFNVAGYTQPPFFCFICGETFNNHDDFITHLISHVQAYEENNYE